MLAVIIFKVGLIPNRIRSIAFDDVANAEKDKAGDLRVIILRFSWWQDSCEPTLQFIEFRQ
jgi:hypothetical protein